MYNQDQNYGHFGAPDYLGAPSIADWAQSAQEEEKDRYATSDVSFFDTIPFQSGYTPPAYVRAGQSLPMLEDGATDVLVKQVAGIQGLVSAVQRRMGLTPTGSLSDSQIKSYQTQKGLSADGIIGPKTYQKLGFTGPFQGSSSSSFQAKEAIAIGDPRPWYMKPKNIAISVASIALLGIGGYYIYQNMTEEE